MVFGSLSIWSWVEGCSVKNICSPHTTTDIPSSCARARNHFWKGHGFVCLTVLRACLQWMSSALRVAPGAGELLLITGSIPSWLVKSRASSCEQNAPAQLPPGSHPAARSTPRHAMPRSSEAAQVREEQQWHSTAKPKHSQLTQNQQILKRGDALHTCVLTFVWKSFWSPVFKVFPCSYKEKGP